MKNVREKLRNSKFSNIVMIYHLYVRNKFEKIENDDSDPKMGRAWIEREYNLRKIEIDDLWEWGELDKSLNKTIELYNFLEYHGAMDLRLSYCGPCSE